MPNEHTLTGKVRERIEAMRLAGVPVWGAKLAGGPYQRVGLPDWVLCVNGLFLAMETKHPDGTTKPTPVQQRELELIERAGGLARVPRSMTEVDAAIQALLHR